MFLKRIALVWTVLFVASCGPTQVHQTGCVPPVLTGKTVLVSVVSKAKEGRYDYFELGPVEFSTTDFLRQFNAIVVDGKNQDADYLLEIGLVVSPEGDEFTAYSKLIDNKNKKAVSAIGAGLADHSDKRGYNISDVRLAVKRSLQNMMCEKST